MLTLTRDVIAALDSADVKPCDVIETPTGLSLSTLTADGSAASISVWGGVALVDVSGDSLTEWEFDGFDTVLDAVRFAQDFSWGDYA